MPYLKSVLRVMAP